MFDPSPHNGRRWADLCLAAACALALTVPTASRASTLSDNLSAVSEDSVTASLDHWLAASFTTDTAIGTGDTLTAVLKAGVLDGSQSLSLYTSDDTGLVPTQWLADFTATSSTSSTSTFSLSGVSLSSASSYWLVLSNASGTSTWQWTADSTGSGTGFTGLWADSDDAGNVWFSNSARYPLQLSVSSSISAVPEPASNVLTLTGLCLLAAMRLRRNDQRNQSNRKG
ncbi:MAG: choice-of-anchor R domain-containing protein [Aquabacterium sp.]